MKLYFESVKPKLNKYKERVDRYKELKRMLLETFRGRPDVIWHALNEGILWELAATPEKFRSTKDALKWALVNKENFNNAKILVNPPIVKGV